MRWRLGLGDGAVSAIPFGECVRNCFCWSQCGSPYVSRNRCPRRNRSSDTSPATISTSQTTRNRATTSGKLAASSDRIKLITVGKTTRGLDWEIAIISSPKNLAQLDRNKEISQRLAHGRGLDDATAHALAREGKAIVHLDGGPAFHGSRRRAAVDSAGVQTGLHAGRSRCRRHPRQRDPDAVADAESGRAERGGVVVPQESRHAVRSLARCRICTRNTSATTTTATAT